MLIFIGKINSIKFDKYIKNYGTICSSIIAIPENKEKTIFLFNDSSPDKNNFYSINTC